MSRTLLPLTVPVNVLVAVAVSTLKALVKVAVEPLFVAAVRAASAVASPLLDVGVSCAIAGTLRLKAAARAEANKVLFIISPR